MTVSPPESATVMDDSVECFDALIRSGARRLTGYQRRLFLAEVATELCGGRAVPAKPIDALAWGRDTVENGLHELHHGVRRLENFAVRGRRCSEQKDPRTAADIRAIVEPHTHADSATQVGAAVHQPVGGRGARWLDQQGLFQGGVAQPAHHAGHPQSDELPPRAPSEGKPLKKTDATDAIFAHVKGVQKQVRNDPETLEISMDTKAKVALGEYVRGGKTRFIRRKARRG